MRAHPEYNGARGKTNTLPLSCAWPLHEPLFRSASLGLLARGCVSRHPYYMRCACFSLVKQHKTKQTKTHSPFASSLLLACSRFLGINVRVTFLLRLMLQGGPRSAGGGPGCCRLRGGPWSLRRARRGSVCRLLSFASVWKSMKKTKENKTLLRSRYLCTKSVTAIQNLK